MIYLDSAATTQVKQEVIDAMMPYFGERFYNPSSLYGPSIDVANDVYKARETVGKFIGARPEEIYFTSGGSESNCWAIQGFMKNSIDFGETPLVITSKVEHKSIIECVNSFSSYARKFINVNKDGFVDLEELNNILEESYQHRAIIVSIQFANNEIGTIQNIKKISDLVHRYGGIFHTDAVQAFGHVPIDVNDLGIDLMSCSGHKIGAPKGIGFLFKKKGIRLNPLIYGSQMDGLRGGTENVPYIIGMAKAVELCTNKIKPDSIWVQMKARDYLIDFLITSFGCVLNGSRDKRLPTNINVTFPQNITGEELIYRLDMEGVYISAGSACNASSHKPSYVLEAIGVSEQGAKKSIRISLPDICDFDIVSYSQMMDDVMVVFNKVLNTTK